MIGRRRCCCEEPLYNCLCDTDPVTDFLVESSGWTDDGATGVAAYLNSTFTVPNIGSCFGSVTFGNVVDLLAPNQSLGCTPPLCDNFTTSDVAVQVPFTRLMSGPTLLGYRVDVLISLNGDTLNCFDVQNGTYSEQWRFRKEFAPGELPLCDEFDEVIPLFSVSAPPMPCGTLRNVDGNSATIRLYLP